MAVLTLAQPVLAVTADDLDLSSFPEESTVVEIAQDDEGQPLELCARPVRKKWTGLAGPPTVKWVLVPLKDHAPDGHGGIRFVWVKIRVPRPPKDWYVEGIECIPECPQGSSGKSCVASPRTPCGVCEK